MSDQPVVQAANYTTHTDSVALLCMSDQPVVQAANYTTHTDSVALLCMSDQPVVQDANYTTHNKHKTKINKYLQRDIFAIIRPIFGFPIIDTSHSKLKPITRTSAPCSIYKLHTDLFGIAQVPVRLIFLVFYTAHRDAIFFRYSLIYGRSCHRVWLRIL